MNRRKSFFIAALVTSAIIAVALGVGASFGLFGFSGAGQRPVAVQSQTRPSDGISVDQPDSGQALRGQAGTTNDRKQHDRGRRSDTDGQRERGGEHRFGSFDDDD
jgi:hypothetical protein